MPTGEVPGQVIQGMPMAPGGMSGFAVDSPDVTVGTGIDPDRFAAGDGVSHQFTNLLYLDTEALYWSISGTKVPPLLTTGIPMPPGFPQGALGMPGTRVLLGGSDTDTGFKPGGRVRAGFWFDRDHSIGFEGSYFYLCQDTAKASQSSDGSIFLGVPLVTGTGAETVLPLAGAGIPGMGGLQVTNRMWGAEANVKGNLLAGPYGHLDLIGGFRVVGFDENLNFRTASAIAGDTLTTHDAFVTRNRFWGGQFGFNSEHRWGCLSVDITTKLALGGTNEIVKTGGMSSFAGSVATSGILVNGLNFGRFSRNQFAVLPEFGIKFGWQLTECMRATLGYNLMYLSEAVRPGEQIDRVVGAGHPQFSWKSSDVFVHGVTAGLEMRY